MRRRHLAVGRGFYGFLPRGKLFVMGEAGKRAGLGFGSGDFVYNCRQTAHGFRGLDKLICARAAESPPIPAIILKCAIGGAV